MAAVPEARDGRRAKRGPPGAPWPDMTMSCAVADSSMRAEMNACATSELVACAHAETEATARAEMPSERTDRNSKHMGADDDVDQSRSATGRPILGKEATRNN